SPQITNKMNTPNLTIPLNSSIHDMARQFAAQQLTPEKGMGVYLNTLSVWAVHRYLKWLQIESEPSNSDSWHPGLRALFDVADLVVPNLGKLECRPILSGETRLTLPPEVTKDRIGYIVIQFCDRLQEAQLLGFAPPLAANSLDELKITDLQPLDTLFDVLETLESNLVVTPEKTPVDLSKWWQNIFDRGWQAVEELLPPQTIGLAYRNMEVRRAKLIELVTNKNIHQLTLIFTLKLENPEELGIHLLLLPFGKENQLPPQSPLPPETNLMVLTESGEVFREITAKEKDTFIQYEFTGQPGEGFSIKIGLGEASITEAFII
ncbi:DUF1822 family protein, partial [Limnofasciculus baicalensis]